MASPQNKADGTLDGSHHPPSVDNGVLIGWIESIEFRKRSGEGGGRLRPTPHDTRKGGREGVFEKKPQTSISSLLDADYLSHCDLHSNRRTTFSINAG